MLRGCGSYPRAPSLEPQPWASSLERPSRRATPRVQVALLEGLVQGISSSPPRRVTVRVQVTLLEGLLEGFKSPFSRAYSDGSSKPSLRATPRFLKQPFAKGYSKGSSSPSRRATPRVLKGPYSRRIIPRVVTKVHSRERRTRTSSRPSPPVLSPCSCLGCTSVSARLWRGPLSSNLGRYDHALQFSLLGTVIECSVRCLFNLCTLTCTQPLLWGCYRVVTARCIGGDASIYKYICI